jgi:glycerol-3-phosphate dehydrogenase (NAD(P)+)
MARMKMIAEGVYTAKSSHQLAREHAVDMPIVREIYLVLFENKHPQQALEDLMGRDLKQEKQ